MKEQPKNVFRQNLVYTAWLYADYPNDVPFEYTKTECMLLDPSICMPYYSILDIMAYESSKSTCLSYKNLRSPPSQGNLMYTLEMA